MTMMRSSVPAQRRMALPFSQGSASPTTTTTTTITITTTSLTFLLLLFSWHLNLATTTTSGEDYNVSELILNGSWASEADSLRPLTIGYLPIDKTHPEARYQLVERQYRVISGALTFAIEVINRKRVIPGYRLRFVWNDTHGTISGGLRAITDQWTYGVDMFLGPEETCHYEGRLAAAWNLPMLSYKCSDDEVSDKDAYPTFARTRPPAAQVTTSVLSLLLHFNWTRFSLIVGSTPTQQKMAQRLEELASEHNLTVNHRKDFKEPHMSLVAGNPFPEIVQETYVGTRVYVFLGQLNAMVDFMTNLNDRGLLKTGDYMVIFIDQRSRTQDNDPLKYFRRTFDSSEVVKFRDGERSLLVITPTAVASTTNTSIFHQRVLHYNALPPFQFPNPFNFTKKITDYAAYLYDAVWLYAVAVAEVLAAGGSVRNGTAIVDRILGRSYRSVLGYNTRIDKNGNALGHYTMLAFKRYNSQFYNFSMKPVAEFETNGGDRPTFKMFPWESIPWINGQPPVAEPRCGYLGQRCIPPRTYILEIILGVVGGVVLICAVIALTIYRNWRYEQEIDGLLWKVPYSSIMVYQPNDKPQPQDGGNEICKRDGTFGEKAYLGCQVKADMMSIASTESRTQTFVLTGKLKGQRVALKVYDKQKVDLGRKTKKEMKLLRDMRHENVNPFIGASLDSDCFILITEYCGKGSLTDVLAYESSRLLDDMILSSLVTDLLQGMIYLHDSELQFHGALKSSNCLVTSRWKLQVGDFGLLDVRSMTYSVEDEHAYFRNMLWKAPELLRAEKPLGSAKGDVYAFGITLYEIYGRAGPYGNCDLEPKEIVDKVKRQALMSDSPFRPDVTKLECKDFITSCMQECWSELPEQRPDFKLIYHKLKSMRDGLKRNIFDQIIAMMENYQERLEDLVKERTQQLEAEKKTSEDLLFRMIPASVAEQLKKGKVVIPESFDCVTIYFSDIVGFTKLSSESTPLEVVGMLNSLYSTFDDIIRSFDVYKVETIGDAYMVVSGLPLRNGDLHAGEVASMSLALLAAIQTFRIPHRPEDRLKLRIGIHSGSCVAGVVGNTMPRYCLFGDTVNTASRMESNGEALRVHCSPECKDILDKLGGYNLERRGLVEMKGKGKVLTYWLNGENADVRKERLEKAGMMNTLSPEPCSWLPIPRTSSCLRYSYRSSSPKSRSPSPSPSPMLSGKSAKGQVKVRVADSSAASPEVVKTFFKDSDGARSGSGECINGMSVRDRLNSFKGSFHRKASSLKVASTPALPGVHETQNHKANTQVGTSSQLIVPDTVVSVRSEISNSRTPTLKGRRRDNNVHCLSVYDNASPSELSDLLGEEDRKPECIIAVESV